MSEQDLEKKYKGSLAGVIRFHVRPITKICCSSHFPDVVITASKDHNIMAWKLMYVNSGFQNKAIKFFYGHSDSVSDMSISSDGLMLVSCSWDKTIIIWDFLKGSIIKQIMAHNDHITCVTFSYTNKEIISGSKDCYVRVWGLDGNKILQMVYGNSVATAIIPLPSSSNQAIVSGYNDGGIKVWDFGKMCIKVYQCHSKQINTFALSLDSKYLISGSTDRQICIWNVDNHDISKRIEVKDSVKCIAMNPTYNIFAAGVNNEINFYHLAGHCFHSITPEDVEGNLNDLRVTCLCWSRDATKLYAGFNDSKIRIYSFQLLGMPTLSVIKPT